MPFLYILGIMSEFQTSVELPIIDISQPIHPSSLSFLAEACKKWGFFHIINHGISIDLYSKIYILSKELFNLPSDTKLKLGPFSSAKTYTPHFIASPYFESLRVAGPNFFASAQSSANILFVEQNSQFRYIGRQQYSLVFLFLNFLLLFSCFFSLLKITFPSLNYLFF